MQRETLYLQLRPPIGMQFLYAKLRCDPPARMGRKPKAAAGAAAAAVSDGDADPDADDEFFEDGASAEDEGEEAAGQGGGSGRAGKRKRGSTGPKEELRPWLYLMPGLIRLGYQVRPPCLARLHPANKGGP